MTNWNMRTEPLELKDGSTIKNYHYEFNSTDRVVAKIVEDVFKAIMDISADRKTENSSEKPNNCEGEPNLSEIPSGSTISKMEQVDKDINVRSKDCETCKHYKLACELFSEVCKYEPITQMKTQNSNFKRTMRDCYNCKRYVTEGECIECHYEPKDEPQTDCAWK